MSIVLSILGVLFLMFISWFIGAYHTYSFINDKYDDKYGLESFYKKMVEIGVLTQTK